MMERTNRKKETGGKKKRDHNVICFPAYTTQLRYITTTPHYTAPRTPHAVCAGAGGSMYVVCDRRRTDRYSRQILYSSKTPKNNSTRT